MQSVVPNFLWCFASLRENSYKIKRMKLFYLCLFTFAFLLSTACRPAAAPVSVSEKPVSINSVPQTNLPLPPTGNVEKFGWTLANNERQTLKDLKGKVVVLDFWATYCPPCLEEIPHLVGLQKQHGGGNFQIIGLNAGGDEDAPKVPRFVEKLKINYTLATPDEELIDLLFGGDDSIPQTFVFDRDGKLLKKFVGYDLKVKNDLDKAVEQALNQ